MGLLILSRWKSRIFLSFVIFCKRKGEKFMRKRKAFKQTMAMILSLAMLLGLLPFNMMGNVQAASDDSLEVTEPVEKTERETRKRNQGHIVW